MKRKLLALVLALALVLPLTPAADVFAEGENPFEDPDLKFYGTSLTLENNIAVNFLVKKDDFVAAGYRSPRVTFSFMGREIVENHYEGHGGYYYFTFRGIRSTGVTAVGAEDEIPLTSCLLGETITATLSGYSDTAQERFYGQPVTESILSYCQRALATPETYTYETFPTLIVDLLTYGAKSQTYFGFDTEHLVTSALSPVALEAGTDTIPSPVSIKNTSFAAAPFPAVKWHGASLDLEDSIKLQFYFKTDSIAELKIEIRDDSDALVAAFTEDDMERVNGIYRISCSTVTPDRMGDALYVTAISTREPMDLGDHLEEGELPFVELGVGTVSDTLRYSIESYAVDAGEQYSSDTALLDLIRAILNYGASAKAFVEETAHERKVKSPATTPLYTFDHENPTTDELRAMAIKAMRDMLTVQWYSENDLGYTYSGTEYPLYAAQTYAGVPYSGAGTGLLHWLQYYNPRTGKMTVSGSDIADKLGCSCATGLMWGWSSVVTSITWNATHRMTPARGCIPVGNYTMPDILLNDSNKGYKDYTTDQIINDNGEDAILEAYARVLPADALVSYVDSDTAHARMVIEEPVVVRYGNGKINPNSSYVYIQDQHKGQRLSSGWPIVTSGGQTLHYAGHTRQQIYFKDLLNDGYIPVTTAEFTGFYGYIEPGAYTTYSGSISHLSDLQKVTVKSYYRIVTVKAVIRDGDTVIDESKTVCPLQITSADEFSYKLTSSNFDLPGAFESRAVAGKTYTLTLEVLLASGSTHTALTAKITKN